MSSDNLDGIFDHLTPDMFITETSAIDESCGVYEGAVAFDAMVDERIRGIRAAFASSFGQINPIAVLANDETQRVFVPSEDENLGHFLTRLQREAMTLGAHWLFFAKRNIVAVYYPDADNDEESPDAGTDAAMAASQAYGAEPAMGVLWYAERREGDEVHHRHGVLKIEGAKIVGATEGDGSQTIGVFSAVLDAVRSTQR